MVVGSAKLRMGEHENETGGNWTPLSRIMRSYFRMPSSYT